MIDFRLLNGGPKGTIIERFNGTALLIRGEKRKNFSSLEELKKHIAKLKLEVNIEHVFGPTIHSKEL